MNGEKTGVAAADVAGRAGFPLNFFAKVGAYLAMTAFTRFGKAADFAIALPGLLLLGRIGDLLDEMRQQTGVFFLPKYQTIGRTAVPAGAARFLIVLLDRFGQ